MHRICFWNKNFKIGVANPPKPNNSFTELDTWRQASLGTCCMASAMAFWKFSSLPGWNSAKKWFIRDTYPLRKKLAMNIWDEHLGRKVEVLGFCGAISRSFFFNHSKKKVTTKGFFSWIISESLTGYAGDENSSCKFLSWILVDKSGSHLFFDLLPLMVQKSQNNYLGWC